MKLWNHEIISYEAVLENNSANENENRNEHENEGESMARPKKNVSSNKKQAGQKAAKPGLLLLPETSIDEYVHDAEYVGCEPHVQGGEPANANMQGSQANAIEYFAGEILYKAYKSVVKDQKDPLLLTLGEVASKVAGNNNTSRSYLGKGFGVLAAYMLIDYHLRRKK